MLGRYVLFAGFVVFAVGGIFSRMDPADMAEAAPVKEYSSSPNSWSKDEVLEARDGGNWRGTVRLERARDGHYYSFARMGGTKVKVMVDTGASIVALTGEDARRAGLSWNESEVRVIGRGASGDVEGVVRRIPRLDVGGIVARNVEAVIVPEGLDVTLLGQSYLAHVRKVEIKGGTMILSNM